MQMPPDWFRAHSPGVLGQEQTGGSMRILFDEPDEDREKKR
jgi:hypothetical protein